MTGAVFEYVFDDARILGVLDRLEASIADDGPLLRQIGQYGVDSTTRRFGDQAGPDGAAWVPLNPAYAELKAATGGSPDILRFHGDLLRSQHYVTAPSAVSWGSGMVYAAVQQFGATIVPKQAKALAFVLGGTFAAGNSGAMGKTQGVLVLAQSVTIPARPYLGLSVVDREEIVALTEDYLRGLIGDA